MKEINLFLYFGIPTPQELASILEWVNGGDLRGYYLFEKRENLLLLERLEEPKLLLNPITCSIEIDLPFILNLLKESAHLRLKVCASSLFLKRYADYYTQLETSLYSSHQMNNYRTHELLYRHEEIVENFFQHLFNSESFYKLTPFNQLFSNLPAVICGAGPTLDKEIETLRTLKNRALILSIGSGFTALTGHGICPHLAVAEDGSEGEYESLHLHSGYEVPFFYSTRLNFSVLSLIHGKKRKFSFKEFYPFEKLFSSLFETIPLLEIPKGPASLSSGIQLATFLGCRPIFLVGIDYAYIEERGYSSKAGGTTPTQEESTIVTVKDSSGVLKETKWEWVYEAQWLKNVCELYPDLFIRTSQQGLQFTENTPSLSLEEACTRQWAIEGQIHTALESCKKEETDEILNRLRCVYKHVESCLSMVNEQKSALINRSSTNIDLNTNLFYKKMVEPLLNEVVSPLKKSADQIVCALSGEAFTLDTKEWTFDLLKLNYIEQVVTIHHMLWTHYSNHWTKFSSV